MKNTDPRSELLHQLQTPGPLPLPTERQTGSRRRGIRELERQLASLVAEVSRLSTELANLQIQSTPPDVVLSLSSEQEQLLTRRELQVLRLYGKWQRVASVAGYLRTSPHTVKNQLASIQRKLGCASRVELLREIRPARIFHEFHGA